MDGTPEKRGHYADLHGTAKLTDVSLRPMRDDFVLWLVWASSAVVLGAAFGLAYSLM